MAKFSIEEIIKATGGSLIKGRAAKATGVSIDTRSIRRGNAYVAIKGEKHDGHKFIAQAIDKGASICIVSKAAIAKKYSGKTFVVVADTTLAFQALACFHRLRCKKLKVVCVTGSNGKTTVKDMIAAVLSRKYKTLKTEGNLNNHIGAPLTVLRLTDKHEAAVIELGMNAPGEIATLTKIASPDIGVITNVSLAHIGNFKSLDQVRKAKAELIENMGEKSIAVLNASDPDSAPLIASGKRKTITFGRDPFADVSLNDSWPNSGRGRWAAIEYKGKETLAHIPLMGAHHVDNALAAFAVGALMKVDGENIAKGIDKVRPAPMRMEPMVAPNRAFIINDAYNANPASTIVALNTAQGYKKDGRLIFVFGDMLELGERAELEHKRIGKAAAKACVDEIYTMGPLAKITGQNAKGALVTHGKTHAGIARAIAKSLQPEDTVLIKGSRGMAMEKVLAHLTERVEG